MKNQAPTLPAARGSPPPERARTALERPRGGAATRAGPRTRIKICGFTREQDLDDAVAAGIDAAGFVLYAPSPRAVTPQGAAELARRLRPFVTPVLLFVNADDALLAEAAEAVPQALWQFHGDETPERCDAVTGNGRRPYLRAARIPLGDDAPRFDLLEFSHLYSNAQAILLDAHVDG